MRGRRPHAQLRLLRSAEKDTIYIVRSSDMSLAKRAWGLDKAAKICYNIAFSVKSGEFLLLASLVSYELLIKRITNNF